MPTAETSERFIAQMESNAGSPTEEIGWSRTQEIRWYPFEEIEGVRSEEILHLRLCDDIDLVSKALGGHSGGVCAWSQHARFVI